MQRSGRAAPFSPGGRLQRSTGSWASAADFLCFDLFELFPFAWFPLHECAPLSLARAPTQAVTTSTFHVDQPGPGA